MRTHLRTDREHGRQLSPGRFGHAVLHHHRRLSFRDGHRLVALALCRKGPAACLHPGRVPDRALRRVCVGHALRAIRARQFVSGDPLCHRARDRHAGGPRNSIAAPDSRRPASVQRSHFEGFHVRLHRCLARVALVPPRARALLRPRALGISIWDFEWRSRSRGLVGIARPSARRARVADSRRRRACVAWRRLRLLGADHHLVGSLSLWRRNYFRQVDAVSTDHDHSRRRRSASLSEQQSSIQLARRISVPRGARTSRPRAFAKRPPRLGARRRGRARRPRDFALSAHRKHHAGRSRPVDDAAFFHAGNVDAPEW